MDEGKLLLGQQQQEDGDWAQGAVVIAFKAPADLEMSDTASKAGADQSSGSNVVRDGCVYQGSVRYILSSLKSAGADLQVFLSGDRDVVLCLVRLPEIKMRNFARNSQYKVLLNSKMLEEFSHYGYKDRHKEILPFPIAHNTAESTIRPFEYIYGLYDTGPDLAPIFERGDCLKPSEVFMSLDRIRLTHSFLKTPHEQGGAGLVLATLEANGSILACFPLHNPKELEPLGRSLLRWRDFPWQVPLDKIRGYFGEKIGMYFMFLSLYEAWIYPLAILSVMATMSMVMNGFDSDTDFMPFYSIAVSLWAVLFLEHLKRREARVAMEWGTSDFEDEEEARQEFEGILGISHITGRREKYFSTSAKRWRGFSSLVMLLCMLLMVLVAVVSVYGFEAKMKTMEATKEYATLLASFLSVVQIQVMSLLYSRIAVYLNNLENHRTDTEFEDALIFKNFMFHIINSYSALAYTAFVKEHLYPDEDIDSMANLRTSLAVIFIGDLVLGNVSEILIPYLRRRCCRKHRDAKDHFVENQLQLDEYHIIDDVIMDYTEIVVQFGYMTFFVVAFPMAPLIALLQNHIELRSDAFKLLHLTRRPEPRAAQDIGSWQQILALMARVAVVTNGALLAFTSGWLARNVEDPSLALRIWVFISYQYAISMLMTILDYAIPDVPVEVTIQLQRQQFITSKVIEKVPDIVALNSIEVKEGVHVPIYDSYAKAAVANGSAAKSSSSGPYSAME